MASTRSDPDPDDDFSDIYKEYTGPQGTAVNNVQDTSKPNKRSHAGSDEEEEQLDPNAVPTDFTSREAKVWEAKSKATERNWKKRKEEELICKICGESGHFTQGCPSTLGNRKAQDFFERVPARDKHVRALFSMKVIERIERDTGCKIKMDEKFLIVSGKDRLILRKGVDAVHKVREEGEQKGSSGSHRSRSRSLDRSPMGLRSQNSESLRSHLAPPNTSNVQRRFDRKDKDGEDRIHEERKKLSRGSPQAFGSDRARSRSNHSKSPGRPHYSGWDKPYDNSRQISGASRYRTDGWGHERQISDIQQGYKFERPSFQQPLEELEMEFKREAVELEKNRDKEEDEENKKHRETIREMRENYMKKQAALRAMHTKQWEEFLLIDAQRRQEQARQQMAAASGFGSYRQFGYNEYDGGYHGNPPYAATNMGMDSKGRYQNQVENYPSRPHDNYGGFQRQRREDYGKAYNRY